MDRRGLMWLGPKRHAISQINRSDPLRKTRRGQNIFPMQLTPEGFGFPNVGSIFCNKVLSFQIWASFF